MAQNTAPIFLKTPSIQWNTTSTSAVTGTDGPDGTVKTTDLLRQGGVGGGSAALHTTVVTEPAAFQGVDCDRDSGLLAAYSTLGGLWRLQLS